MKSSAGLGQCGWGIRHSAMRHTVSVLHIRSPSQETAGEEAQARSGPVCTQSLGEPDASNEKSPSPDSLQVGPLPAAVMSHCWEVSPDADWLDVPLGRGKRLPEITGGALG